MLLLLLLYTPYNTNICDQKLRGGLLTTLIILSFHRDVM